MNLFKEVADIKTADQLHLPTPQVEYHNIVAQPTEIQKEMVGGVQRPPAGLLHRAAFGGELRAIAFHRDTKPPCHQGRIGLGGTAVQG